jgi:hypothetical protein
VQRRRDFFVLLSVSARDQLVVCKQGGELRAKLLILPFPPPEVSKPILFAAGNHGVGGKFNVGLPS